MMTFRDMIAEGGIVLAPGIYDALSGLIATQMGARAVYLSGASLAYTRFGRSDVGLVSVSEVHDTLAAITDRIDTPVIVDADNGFGNALNVQRTVRYFERAGAAAIQLEDQSFPKRCGHLDGKKLISSGEMVGKVKAALDARCDQSTLIIARTDARAVEGFAAALDRGVGDHHFPIHGDHDTVIFRSIGVRLRGSLLDHDSNTHTICGAPAFNAGGQANRRLEDEIRRWSAHPDWRRCTPG